MVVLSRLLFGREPAAEPRVGCCSPAGRQGWSRRNVLPHLEPIPHPREGPRSHRVEDWDEFWGFGSVEVKQTQAEPHEQSYFLPGWKKEVPGISWEGQVS